ncbi:hypothetical protein [Paenibacillus odorifer]|uniref:hypothetical protein n=1 Tax=Paenibacillus odorifer TaxID=189426 RepID=UPI0015BBD39C|nr:hypothetical protein [Paenibacillus odorifer]
MQKFKNAFNKISRIIKQQGPAFLMAIARNTVIILLSKALANVISAHFGIGIS